MSVLHPDARFRTVAPGCERAALPSPWPPGVVAVFLIRCDGWWLVDTGSPEPDAVADLEVALRARIGSSRELRGVVLTHGHLDHVGGLAALGPLALVAHAKAAEWMRAEGRLPEDAVVETVEGERGALPGLADWEWVLGEGHAPGHLLPWHAASRTLIAGDQFLDGLKTPLRVGDPAEDSYGAYLDTLRRVSAIEPRRLLPSHTDAILDPAGWLERRERHMRRQLARTLEAIRDHPRTAREVVRHVYRTVPSSGALQLLLREETAALRHLHLRGLAERVDDGGVERFVAPREPAAGEPRSDLYAR